MPKDSAGKFHLNAQRAAASDKNAGFKPGSASAHPPAAHGGDTPHAMLSKLHASSGGKHMHIHSHGMGHTTHHIDENGNVCGPDEHGSDDELKEHVGSVMGDGSSSDQMDDDTGKHLADSDSDYY